MGDYIEKGGKRYSANPLTDVGDEYRGINGRGLEYFQLERGGILGDRISY